MHEIHAIDRAAAEILAPVYRTLARTWDRATTERALGDALGPLFSLVDPKTNPKGARELRRRVAEARLTIAVATDAPIALIEGRVARVGVIGHRDLCDRALVARSVADHLAARGAPERALALLGPLLVDLRAAFLAHEPGIGVRLADVEASITRARAAIEAKRPGERPPARLSAG